MPSSTEMEWCVVREYVEPDASREAIAAAVRILLRLDDSRQAERRTPREEDQSKQ